MTKLSVEGFGGEFGLVDETPLFGSKFYAAMHLAVAVWLSVSIFGSLMIWVGARESTFVDLVGLCLLTMTMFFFGKRALMSLNKAHSNSYMTRIDSSVVAVRVGVFLFFVAVACGGFLCDALGYYLVMPLMGQAPNSSERIIIVLLSAALMGWVSLRVGGTLGKVHKYAALDRRLVPYTYQWGDNLDSSKVIFHNAAANKGEFKPIGERLRPHYVSKLWGETEAALGTFLVGVVSGVMMCLTAMDGNFAGWLGFSILNTSMIILFHESVLCESRDVLYRNLFAYHNHVVETKNSTLITDNPSGV